MPGPDPPWLTRLREALLAESALPEVEEAFVHEEMTYVAHRRVDYDDTRLAFHEVWLEPQTYRAVKSWQAELEPGAWAGNLPETVFRQQMAALVQWLDALRPHTVRREREREREFRPGRFARQSPGR